MPQQFTIVQLDALVALADELHFGRAAERLFMARPAFTRAIQHLERQVGCRLVDRTTRSVSLTPAGEVFAADARRLVALADDAVRSARDVADGRTGLVRIGFTGPAMIATLPDLLGRWRTERPELRFDVHEMPTAAQITALDRGDLDIGFFLAGHEVPSSIRTVPVVEDEAVIGVPRDHPLAGRESLRLADLADETLILFPRERNPALYDEVVALASDNGRRSVHVEEASSRAVAAGLVAAGFGVATFTASMAGLCGPDVVLVPQREPTRRTTVVAGWRPDAASPFGDLIELASTGRSDH